MTTLKKKAGRKPIPHRRSSDNKTIDGLYRCPDGRWKIVANGYRYTEPDENLAIAFVFGSVFRWYIAPITSDMASQIEKRNVATDSECVERTRCCDHLTEWKSKGCFG